MTLLGFNLTETPVQVLQHGGRDLACYMALELLCFCAINKAFGYDIGPGNSVD